MQTKNGVMQSSGVFDAGPEWRFKIQSGQIDGYQVIDKFGINSVVTTGTDPEDIWEFGGVYTYDDVGTAPIMYASSDSTADTVEISIEGLDIDGNYTYQTVTLTGQTNVSLTTPLWRVFRMSNIDSTDISGVVYCHTDSAPTSGVPADANVRAIINGDKNQTLMAVYTVPLGKVGFLFRGEFGLELEGNAASLSEYAHCHYESRRVGKVFNVKKAVTIFPGQSYSDYRTFPDPIPALTDIKMVAEYVSQEMGLWGTFDILIVDESELLSDFLDNIGQPSIMPSE